MTPNTPDFELLKEKINSKKIVSFDVFDTLLLRNVHQPRDVFWILDLYAKNRFGIPDFYQMRVDAENQARKFVKNSECNYQEIYDVLAEKIGKYANWMQEREIQAESLVLTENPFMKKAFWYAYENQKEIFVISDMYLPSEIIQSFLKENGYPDCKIFVSDEYRCTKHSGELFQLVKKRCGLDNKSWLHIGDNPISDCKVPFALGIETFLYKNVSTYEKAEPKTLEERIFWGIQNNAKHNGEKPISQRKTHERYLQLFKQITDFCK